MSCGKPPSGYARWSLRLLAEQVVELQYIESLSRETVRQALKKTNSSPGAKNAG
jgi:glutaredoxin-related protein